MIVPSRVHASMPVDFRTYRGSTKNMRDQLAKKNIFGGTICLNVSHHVFGPIGCNSTDIARLSKFSLPFIQLTELSD